MYAYNMKVDLDKVGVEPLEDGYGAFHEALNAVLERIAPFVATAPGLKPAERVRRLGAAINVALDSLEELTGMVDTALLPALIERITDLAVTGSDVEVQIGVAGDLGIDKRCRLVVDDLLVACARVPLSMRAAALREGVSTLQRLLALLLLQGWSDETSSGPEAVRQHARRAIVEAVQGNIVESRES
jgi:hypothetical protein